jgi:hypothetical protein
MTRSPYLKSLLFAVVVLAAGLALGAGKTSEDTSAANTASKVLLPLGLLIAVVSVVLEVRRRRRDQGPADA